MGVYVKDITPLVMVRKVSHGMVEIKLFCFRWLSPFFTIV
jgi:hypothetical protein